MSVISLSDYITNLDLKTVFSNRISKYVPDIGMLRGMTAWCLVATLSDHVSYEAMQFGLMFLPDYITEVSGNPIYRQKINEFLNDPYDVLTKYCVSGPLKRISFLIELYRGVTFIAGGDRVFFQNLDKFNEKYRVNLSVSNVKPALTLLASRNKEEDIISYMKGDIRNMDNSVKEVVKEVIENGLDIDVHKDLIDESILNVSLIDVETSFQILVNNLSIGVPTDDLIVTQLVDALADGNHLKDDYKDMGKYVNENVSFTLKMVTSEVGGNVFKEIKESTYPYIDVTSSELDDICNTSSLLMRIEFVNWTMGKVLKKTMFDYVKEAGFRYFLTDDQYREFISRPYSSIFLTGFLVKFVEVCESFYVCLIRNFWGSDPAFSTIMLTLSLKLSQHKSQILVREEERSRNWVEHKFGLSLFGGVDLLRDSCSMEDIQEYGLNFVGPHSSTYMSRYLDDLQHNSNVGYNFKMDVCESDKDTIVRNFTTVCNDVYFIKLRLKLMSLNSQLDPLYLCNLMGWLPDCDEDVDLFVTVYRKSKEFFEFFENGQVRVLGFIVNSSHGVARDTLDSLDYSDPWVLIGIFVSKISYDVDRGPFSPLLSELYPYVYNCRNFEDGWIRSSSAEFDNVYGYSRTHSIRYVKTKIRSKKLGMDAYITVNYRTDNYRIRLMWYLDRMCKHYYSNEVQALIQYFGRLYRKFFQMFKQRNMDPMKIWKFKESWKKSVIGVSWWISSIKNNGSEWFKDRWIYDYVILDCSDLGGLV